MDVWRTADTVEHVVMVGGSRDRRSDEPDVFVTSCRLCRSCARSARRGAYVRARTTERPESNAVLIATGSEVGLAIDAQKQLSGQGINVRVVSMPSTTVFDKQDARYKSQVLPEGLPRIAIEAGVTDFWWKYVRAGGAVIGVDRFGERRCQRRFKFFNLTFYNVSPRQAGLLRIIHPIQSGAINGSAASAAHLLSYY